MTQALNIYTPISNGGSQSATDASSYATASYTPTTGRTTIAAIVSYRAAGSITNPTATQTSLTLTLRESVVAPGGLAELHVFTAPSTGSPAAGVLTFDYAGQTQDGAAFMVFEVDADVADIIVQSVTGTVAAGTTYTMTLPGAVASALNGTLAIIACDANSSVLRPEVGYTSPTPPNVAVMAMPFRDATPFTLAMGFRPVADTACVVTQGSSNGMGVLLELRNPNAIQAGAYTLSGVVEDNGTPISGATVRIIDEVTGDSITTTTNGSGVWSQSVNFNTANRYSAMVNYTDGGSQRYNALAYFDLTAA